MTGKPRLPRGMRRSLANNRRLRSSATSEAEAVFDPIVPLSKKPNARYGPAAFHAIMMGAAALGASIFGYTAAVRRLEDGLMHARQAPPRGPLRRVDVPHLPGD